MSPAADDELRRHDADELGIESPHVVSWRTQREQLRSYAHESGFQQFMARMLASSSHSQPLTTQTPTIDGTNLELLGIQRSEIEGMLGTLGHYQLTRELGRGGMAIVYEAIDQRMGRHVAVKIQLSPESQSSSRERVQREARALAKLSHPNILAIYDLGSTGSGMPYLVTELASEGTLRDRMRGEPLPVDVACEIAACIADGLEVAHHAGIVHRDIKPSNILLDHRTGGAAELQTERYPALASRGWVPKIADFGLARPSDEAQITKSSVMSGTPAYMSPEQIHAPSGLQNSTDLYSLGVTFFEMLTGETPFRGSPQAILQQIVDGEVPPPRKWNRNIPQDLETIVLHAMELEASHRYASARHFADDLRRFLRKEPIAARPISSWGRLRRWCGRHRTIAALSGVIAILLTFGTFASVVGVVSLQSAYQQTLESNQRLERAVQKADEAFDLSQDTLQTIVVRLREDLYQLPQATSLVVQTSQESAEMHRRLLALRPGDLRSTKALAETLDYLANAEWVLGNMDKSRAATRELEHVLERAIQQHPNEFDLLRMWCNHLISRVMFPDPDATPSQQNDYEQRMRQTLAALEAGYPESAAVAKLGMMEAKCQATLAKKAKDDRRILESNLKAVDAASRFAELAGPAELDEARLWQAQTMRVVADYFANREQWDDAESWFRKALATVETNPQLNTERETRDQAAGIQFGLGRILVQREQPEVACDGLRVAEYRFGALVTDFPEDDKYHREWIQSLALLCRTLGSLGEKSEALAVLDAAEKRVQAIPVEALSEEQRHEILVALKTLRERNDAN